MSWNVNFNSHTAEGVYDAVERGKYLAGFSNARDRLEALKRELERLLSEAKWWGDQCESAAVHYEHTLKQLQDYPGNFSDDNAREANSKSPQMLYEYTAALRSGASKLQDAINKIGEILSNLNRAQDEAEEDGKKVLEKIKQAIDLMESYLKVNF